MPTLLVPKSNTNSHELVSSKSRHAWDEEIMKPSSKTMVVEVDSPDMTAFEEVMESLTGEEANPFIQLMLMR